MRQIHEGSPIEETPGKPNPQNKLTTMVFSDPKSFMDFMEYVFNHRDEWGSLGIEFSNAPIPTSIRVRPWLQERLPEEIRNSMRPVTDEDIETEEREFGLSPEEDIFSPDFNADRGIEAFRRHLNRAGFSELDSTQK